MNIVLPSSGSQSDEKLLKRFNETFPTLMIFDFVKIWITQMSLMLTFLIMFSVCVTLCVYVCVSIGIPHICSMSLEVELFDLDSQFSMTM